jgi:hypothetical protein
MAGSTSGTSSAGRGVRVLRDILRKRTQPIALAAMAQTAIDPISISKSINISAVMIIRNAITGLRRTTAQMTKPRAQFRTLLIVLTLRQPCPGSYYDCDHERFIDRP